MYDHISLRVRDLAASTRFYQAALAPLGFVLCSQDDDTASFGPPEAPALWLNRTAEAPTSGVHLAFVATDRAAVDRFYAAAMHAGGRDNGAPGICLEYGPTYYGAFVLDPDGNNVEAVNA
jgi:catechol 2,3-dioxygenase-like lactoylglutathione lyase family enzyme